ncbi:hypothetical protein NECAME_16233 [Necator americanus]|uniref:Uncharacterized protein n=1 Tax=Necator americanus TaxID=51031 RepID=W2U008_NECAM|nr:hypothetical protein NECAME_16233 [Necator americanus]ETN86632.1 hypothetical protein NECAME_16233 [Necator americanus]
MVFTIEPMINQGRRTVQTEGRRLDGRDARWATVRAIRAHRRRDPKRCASLDVASRGKDVALAIVPEGRKFPRPALLIPLITAGVYIFDTFELNGCRLDGSWLTRMFSSGS